jgi:tRNA threonylcarbamoyladenosine biosynthesis protein TsaB
VFGRTLGLPVYGVCTLDILARAAAGAAAGREFLAVTDARRKELYWARYSGPGSRLAGPAVNRAADIPGADALPVAGQAAALYPDYLGEPIWPQYPAAAVLADLVVQLLAGRPDDGPDGGLADGSGVALLPPEPLYLRRPDARVPGPPKRVTAP